MAQLVSSLDNVSSGYPRFKEAQVLTDAHLNGLAEYLDDQARLTRVDLAGVGIVCGLRPSLVGSVVRVSRGLGVTSDGDLVHLAEDRFFEGARPYGPAEPGATVLLRGGARIEAWELLPKGVAPPPDAFPLATFAAQAQRPLDQAAVVLLVESTCAQADVCQADSCDNKGERVEHQVKLLLVDKTAAAGLLEQVQTAAGAARLLVPVVAKRPLLEAVKSPTDLAEAYRKACDETQTALVTALGTTWPICQPFLGDLFAGDPSSRWLDALRQSEATFTGGAATQYRLDFLKDAVETYSAFREQLLEATSCCIPNVGAFPKHLLLGNLTDPAESTANRTRFYPAAQAAPGARRLRHARFLLAKLDLQLRRLRLLTSATQAIQVTPSFSEARSLEDRAIPFYYDLASTPPMHQHWSFELHDRGMDEYAYSYGAAAYQARGGAADPLGSQLSRFDFFRVEGHVGAKVERALTELRAIRKARSLPFQLRAVLVGTERLRIWPWPPRRLTELNRLHDVLRGALADQLDDAVDFADAFRGQVEGAVTAGTLGSDDVKLPTGSTVGQQATARAAELRNAAAGATSALRKRYSEVEAVPTWRGQVDDAQRSLGELKQSLGSVVRTEFTNPADKLIGSTHLQWLDLLGPVIKEQDGAQLDRQLFSKFQEEHPGLEHLGGVAPGGTLVLAYDDAGTVLGDFSLPYRCEGSEKAEPESTPPSKPRRLWPEWVFRNGLTVRPSTAAVAKDGLKTFWDVEKRSLEGQLGTQREYLQLVRDSVQLVGSAVKAPKASVKATLEEDLLEARLRELGAKVDVMEALRRQSLDPSASDEVRSAATTQLRSAESELARTATATVEHVRAAKIQVEPGGPALEALAQVDGAVARLRSPEAVKAAAEGLATVEAKADGPLKKAIELLKRR